MSEAWTLEVCGSEVAWSAAAGFVSWVPDDPESAFEPSAFEPCASAFEPPVSFAASVPADAAAGAIMSDLGSDEP